MKETYLTIQQLECLNASIIGTINNIPMYSINNQIYWNGLVTQDEKNPLGELIDYLTIVYEKWIVKTIQLF